MFLKTNPSNDVLEPIPSNLLTQAIAPAIVPLSPVSSISSSLLESSYKLLFPYSLIKNSLHPISLSSYFPFFSFP